MNNEIKELCSLDMKLYQCITNDIDTNRVVLTDKQILHIADHHPEAYNDVLIELKETIIFPDYIIKDEKHADTGLVIREIPSDLSKSSRMPPPQHFQCRWGMNAFLCKLLDIFY